VVLITAANAAEAGKLAEMLVGTHLAACVQILHPMTSVFHWKGTIQRQNEVLLIAKTESSRFEAIEREVRALHSYETPEIIALPITAGSLPYLKWLSASIGPRQ
jgi:periplasmic divalent cation tolerance protein